MDARETQTRLELAKEAAAEASQLILSHFGSLTLAVEKKGDDSPVTVADRGAEELLRRRIEAEFPDDGILGEEFDDRPSQNGFRWVLDPIDGTKAFIAGAPLFGTLIGVEHEDETVAGVCRFPALDEVVFASSGQGCWHQRQAGPPTQVKVTGTSILAESTFAITETKGWLEAGQFATFERLSRATKNARGWGDCYNHAMVAMGRIDFAVDPGMSPWDASPFVVILREAGGHFLSWDGEESAYGGSGISVNAALKNDVLAFFTPDLEQ